MSGNVGIGTTSPLATLDVNGYSKLKINASAPVTCDAVHEGSIAYAGTTTHYCASVTAPAGNKARPPRAPAPGKGHDGHYAVDAPNPWNLVKAIQKLKAPSDELKAANENLRASVAADHRAIEDLKKPLNAR